MIELLETRYARAPNGVHKAFRAVGTLVFEGVGEHELTGVPDRWRPCRIGHRRDP